jgi:hypothetical protein
MGLCQEDPRSQRRDLGYPSRVQSEKVWGLKPSSTPALWSTAAEAVPFVLSFLRRLMKAIAFQGAHLDGS